MIQLQCKAIVFSIAFFCAYTLPLRAIEKEDVPTKCGTFSPHAIARNKALLEGMKVLDERPALPFTHSSPSGKFLFHYTNTGRDSVPQADIDNNGIPDWVDSSGFYMDYIYNVEVEQMGFQPPPTDGTNGGSIQYDIYFLDLSKVGHYGETLSDGNVSGGKFPRSMSFIKIDNNFSVLDKYNSLPAFSTFGYDALKVTLAHEYHHAIQYGYGSSTGSFHEMTSSWMEFRVYPELTDYLTYVKRFFTNNDKFFFGQSDAASGYSYCHVLEYCRALYGDVFIKRVWDLVGNGVEPANPDKGLEPYRALDSVFVERGSSLNQAWCEFLPWVYYTGKRTIPGKYFSKADIFPEFSASIQEVFSSPSFTHTLQIKPYEIQFSRCILPAQLSTNTPDSADFMITYTSLNDILQQTQRPGEYTIVCSEEPGPNPVVGTRYNYMIKTNTPGICSEVAARNGIATTQSDVLFPNPFHLSSDEYIYFPAPPDARISDKPYLSIYTVDWMNVYSGELPITAAEGNKRVIAWKPNGIELSTNVYIYTIFSHGKTTIGKFSIVQ